jgi:type IV secretion system protein VirB11
MLNLFKDDDVSLSQEEALALARKLLVSSLNKGVIPSWDSFFQDLPTLERPEDLLAIKDKFENLTQWTFLQEIISLEATEYFFHGVKNSQRIDLNGKKQSLSITLNHVDWQLWMEIVSIKFHQNWNVQNPFVSFYGELFGKKFRFSLIHGSTSPLGVSKLVLRFLSPVSHALESYGEVQALNMLVREKKNFLIAGSTGSGKTSLLTSLLDTAHQEEHIVILEDTYEILSSHPYQTRFLSGASEETSLKSYLAYSLRLSPDRIILGEMRSHEVVPFLLAMNTGHRGLIGTIHSTSAVDALNRVSLLFSLYSGESKLNYDKIMELICKNLEYVVFMENKRVKEIIRILGCEQGVPFFESLLPGKEQLF